VTAEMQQQTVTYAVSIATTIRVLNTGVVQ
jgi:hypothetical protein